MKSEDSGLDNLALKEMQIKRSKVQISSFCHCYFKGAASAAAFTLPVISTPRKTTADWQCNSSCTVYEQIPIFFMKAASDQINTKKTLHLLLQLCDCVQEQ